MSDSALPANRRSMIDRRRRPTPMLSRYTLTGRRTGARRLEESVNTYVDRYPAGILAAVIAIVGLCVLDALFTLIYVQEGGAEANPVMDFAIDAGVFPFLAVKVGFTIVGMGFLCLHKNFRFVKPILLTVLVLYAALFLYHLHLAATP